MSYTQLEEPKITCFKCKVIYSLNNPNIQYGLFRGGTLMRCSKCFELMKHNFWLKVMEEE